MTAENSVENRAYEQPAETIRPELTEHSKKMRKKIYKITDNYYLAYGYGLASPSMVIGEKGIIIIDTNEDIEKSEEVCAEFRKITDKPIKAVIITHWHPDHWRGIKGFVSEEEVTSGKVMIIAHKDYVKNVVVNHTGGVGPIMNVRNNFTFGNSLPTGPTGRVNNGIGPDVLTRTPSFIAPTRTFGSTLDIDIEGVRMFLKWVPSETEDEIIVWFPDWKILHTAEVIQGETFPNLHAIRGTQYRNPIPWFKGIDVLRSFDADYMVPAHGRPVFGKKKIQELLISYRDAIQYVHDQTIRNMNKGCTPEELVERVQLPKHLATHPWLGEFYGSVSQSVRQIYNGEVGWFHGDPTQLDPVRPVEAALRYIDLMGGREVVMSEALKALKMNDPQWAAELATYLIRMDKNDMEARHVKAKALRTLGYRQINSNWRNWYLTAALELEGGLDNTKGYTGLTAPDIAKAFPITATVESLTLRLSAEKTYDVNSTMGFRFPLEEIGCGLEIRRGVAQFHTKLPLNPDMILTLDKSIFHELLINKKKIIDFSKSGRIKVEGDIDQVVAFFDYFDLSDDPIYLCLH